MRKNLQISKYFCIFVRYFMRTCEMHAQYKVHTTKEETIKL